MGPRTGVWIDVDLQVARQAVFNDAEFTLAIGAKDSLEVEAPGRKPGQADPPTGQEPQVQLRGRFWLG